MSNAVKLFYILVINLNILRNYFDNPTELFLGLCSVKFLDTLAKLFFPYLITKRKGNWTYKSKRTFYVSPTTIVTKI